jgi:hypothetical protein
MTHLGECRLDRIHDHSKCHDGLNCRISLNDLCDIVVRLSSGDVSSLRRGIEYRIPKGYGLGEFVWGEIRSGRS